MEGRWKLSPWNTSAARVFTDSFLTTRSNTYRDIWPVRRMVLKKTRAYVSGPLHPLAIDAVLLPGSKPVG